MSVFDYLRCDYPLPESRFQGMAFETKDLENYLENFTIRADGSLWRTAYDTEDRSDPNATGLARLAGRATRVNPREEPFVHDGTVNFYADYRAGDPSLGSDSVGWVEFEAEFEAGQLLSLKLVRHDLTPVELALAQAEALESSWAVPVSETSKPRF